MNKKYNPFKMWGSYIVAFIFLGIAYFNSQNCSPSPTAICGGYSLAGYTIRLLIGFLIGWAINAGYRKLK